MGHPDRREYKGRLVVTLVSRRSLYFHPERYRSMLTHFTAFGAGCFHAFPRNKINCWFTPHPCPACMPLGASSIARVVAGFRFCIRWLRSSKRPYGEMEATQVSLPRHACVCVFYYFGGP